VRRAPGGGGQEAPPEELSCLGAELVQVLAAHDHADDTVGLGEHGFDA
jgi:hypothetical protein